MNENDAAAFHHEGQPAFASESNGEDTPSESRSENENQNGDTQSPEGGKENTQGDDKTPFHEHPRWKQREQEWNERFNQQEMRHAEEVKNAIEGIRKEFGQARQENAQNTKIPSWFGGTQEQWDAYRADRDAELKQAGEAAIERFKSESKNSVDAEQKAVKEATDWLNAETAAIEADKTLNPTGAKIDREALLKVVVDNELIDTKGRWNYRAGFKLMQQAASGQQQQQNTQTKEKTDEKKQIAAATTSDNKGDDKPKKYATSEDFKKDRPW